MIPRFWIQRPPGPPSDDESSDSSPSDSQNLELPASPLPDFDDPFSTTYRNVRAKEAMIRDHVETETYKAAINQFQDAIAGKVVLDVGCGTGILGILCAHLGARRVYAVETSEIAFQANEVIKVNNLSEKVIVLQGQVENVLITDEVDVIISEWMGYMLLCESMLPSIIFARNKWLKPGGLILPSHATLWMAPVSHSVRYSESIDFWNDVYGINMSPLLPLAKQCAFKEACIERVSRSNLLASPILVKEVDCYTITVEELGCVTEQFRFMSMSKAPLHGFAYWFMVMFKRPKSPVPNVNPFIPQSQSDEETISLSTAPSDSPTHWNQTLVYLYDPIELEQNQIIQGSVKLIQRKVNPMSMNIHIAFRTGQETVVKETVMGNPR